MQRRPSTGHVGLLFGQVHPWNTLLEGQDDHAPFSLLKFPTDGPLSLLPFLEEALGCPGELARAGSKLRTSQGAGGRTSIPGGPAWA